MDRSEEPADDLQRQRRRLLLDRGRGEDLEVRRAPPAARSSTTSRSTTARRRGRTARSRTSAAAAASWISRQGATGSRPWNGRSAPGGEGSHHAIDPTNPNIVYSHGFYGNFTRDDLSIPPPQRGRRGGGGEAQPGAAAGAAGGPQRSAPTSGRRTKASARSGWRPSSCRRTTRTRSISDYQYVFRSTNRGDDVGEDQRRPDRQRSAADAAAELERDPVPDDHRARRVAARQGADLRRHRRWPAARDDGCGQDLDGSDARVPDAEVVLARRAVAARGRHGLRHAARPRRRRLRAVHLQVHRRRQDLHEHRRQHPGRAGERDPRGSDESRTCSTSAPTSARSSPPTAASSGRCSAATCRRTQVSDLAYHAARQRHRHLDVRPRDLGDRRYSGCATWKSEHVACGTSRDRTSHQPSIPHLARPALLVPERDERIDGRSAPRRHRAGGEAGERQRRQRRGEDARSVARVSNRKLSMFAAQQTTRRRRRRRGPAVISTAARFSTMPTTLPRVAPSAMRTPISLVRCATR